MTSPEVRIIRLTCKAPHARKPGEPCGGPLGDVPGEYEYVTHSDRAPGVPDGFTWLRCTNCERWNKLRPLAAMIPTAPVGSIDERLAKFPEEQQQAILALAGGLRNVQVAQSLGVTRQTIRQWNTNPEFKALRQLIAPSLTANHVRVALDSLMTLIDKEKREGKRGTHTRYFLSRTVFADVEKDRAASGGTAINLNVAQHQQQTQATIKNIWEDRTRAISAAVDPED